MAAFSTIATRVSCGVQLIRMSCKLDMGKRKGRKVWRPEQTGLGGTHQGGATPPYTKRRQTPRSKPAHVVSCRLRQATSHLGVAEVMHTRLPRLGRSEQAGRDL